MQWEERRVLSACGTAKYSVPMGPATAPAATLRAGRQLKAWWSCRAEPPSRQGEPARRCSCEGCGRVRNRQPLGKHPAQPQGKAGVALHPVHPSTVTPAFDKGKGRVPRCTSVGCRSTTFPQDLELSLVTEQPCLGRSQPAEVLMAQEGACQQLQPLCLW